MEKNTETLNLRVLTDLKKLIRAAAVRKERQLANSMEVLVRKHCGE